MDNDYNWIGWISSTILLATIAVQIRKQIRSKSTEGVSKWLFVGQFTAEVGFVAYSWLVRNWVFVFTNSALLLGNMLGLVVLLRQRKKELKIG